MVKLKNRFLNSSIAAKFRAIYIVLIAACIFINAAVAGMFYNHEVRKGIAGLASQTVDTISQNVGSTLQTIAKSSTYLLGTSDVQNYLKDEDSSQDAMTARNLRNALYLSLESMPQVSSILIIHEDGDYDGAARYVYPQMILDRPSMASWYQEARQKRGGVLYRVNGGGYFAPEEENYISLIRQINSTETAQPLGYMMINISVDSLLDFAGEEGYLDICVYVDNEPLLAFAREELNEWLKEQSPQKLKTQQDVTVAGERYLLLKLQEEEQDWYYLSMIPYSSYSGSRKMILVIFGVTGVICGILFLLIAFCSRRFITAPLTKLMGAMKKTEEGEFRKASVTPYQDEIGLLQGAYNEMVEKISQLMEAKIDEQRLLRKAELRVLQEQIKPHFLYNSLSAISYLVTSSQQDVAYEMILALSDYYRESLSKGSEVVTLKTELSIVKNYLKLQKLRFPDLFEDVYEVQEEALGIRIPRLILQPLAENALYHGILPMGDFGTITIEASIRGKKLILQIKDDGVGMNEEKLREILRGNLELNRQSFGLRGTVERLRIFYEEDHIYDIQSAPGEGTRIILSIPIKMEGEEK